MTAATAMVTKTTGMNEVLRATRQLGDAVQAGAIVRRQWVKEVSKTVRPTIRKHVRSAFRGKRKLASSYSAKVSGERISNLRMDVYSRLPASVPHEYGPAAPIFAKSGKSLAIPTHYAMGMSAKIRARSQGRFLRRNLRVKPKVSQLDPKFTYTITSKKGTKIIMMKLDKDKQGAMRRRQKRGIRAAGKKVGEITAVPMFVLKKRVVLRRRTRIRLKFRRLIGGISDRTALALKRAFFKDMRKGATGWQPL